MHVVIKLCIDKEPIFVQYRSRDFNLTKAKKSINMFSNCTAPALGSDHLLSCDVLSQRSIYKSM